MPEYLTPGVYIEETSFRPKSIEGVSTSTCAFVGPTLRGPVPDPKDPNETPEILTSFSDFQRVFGGFGRLSFAGTPPATGGVAPPAVERLNYLALGVKAFFDNGGARLYVARTVGEGAGAAKVEILAASSGVAAIEAKARTPGSGGNAKLHVSQSREPLAVSSLASQKNGTVVRITSTASTPEIKYYVRHGGKWVDEADAELTTTGVAAAEKVSINIRVEATDGGKRDFSGLELHPSSDHWLGKRLPEQPKRRSEQLQNLVWIDSGNQSGLGSKRVLALRVALLAKPDPEEDEEKTFELAGGSDGQEPKAAQYKPALQTLEMVQDISIIAAPGFSASDSHRDGIRTELLTHIDRMPRYRVLVLDTAPNLTPTSARQEKAAISTQKGHASLYYPWLIVANPNPSTNPRRPDEISVPPSGAICGIYARTDVDRGVHKAPANTIVNGALRLERDVNFSEQAILNPIGVNCIRFFPGQGIRVWGARTTASDPEWKYVNIRRYFIYLEASIDRSTQWVVFEPNGERLWANVRQTVASFLYNEWRSGRLLGPTPEVAFFVRCDRSTMTQNDLDNGRLICEIGVAPLAPAEFVIFRIGQKTAEADS